ncbi:MAG TPA: RluA family pseudouridine synthase [Usitatibacter sp.]|nr:RluA family pseudouridine synthase [Usitatibacter sp.]
MKLSVPLEMAGLRLDQALARLLPDQSRSRLARLIEEGHVRVDGAAVAAKRKVKSGELVEVALAPRESDQPFRAEDIALPIVHEDEDLLVVDKPAGLVVHPGSGNWAGTMLNALLHHAPAVAALPRAGIVHRLDKDTSGLLVVAKNEPAQFALVRQLQARTVKRTYLAVARGRVAKDGKVDAPIGRHPVHRTRMAVVADGKPAVTHYRVRERLPHHTLLECDLETGRTHQIRVHLASIGHPLEGDAVYAGRGERLFERQALHAWKLTFVHPRTGAPVGFESPMPADFARLLERLRG